MSAAGHSLRISGVAAPLVRDNVDTDSIIRSRDIDRPTKSGFGGKLFAGWRYAADGVTERADFVLNDARYRSSTILLAGSNFGCGSSREAAVWALLDFGIRGIVAEGFGSIFHANCVVNGLVPVVLPRHELRKLVLAATATLAGPTVIEVYRTTTAVIAPDGRTFAFPLTALHRDTLLSRLDAIDLTMRKHAEIAAFEEVDKISRPWIHVSRGPTASAR